MKRMKIRLIILSYRLKKTIIPLILRLIMLILNYWKCNTSKRRIRMRKTKVELGAEVEVSILVWMKLNIGTPVSWKRKKRSIIRFVRGLILFVKAQKMLKNQLKINLTLQIGILMKQTVIYLKVWNSSTICKIVHTSVYGKMEPQR